MVASLLKPFSTPRLLLVGALVAPLAFGLAFAGSGFFAVFPPVVIVSTLAALSAVLVLFVDRPWVAIVATVVAGLVLGLGASDPTPGAITRPSLGMQMSWGHAARLAGLVGLAAGVVAFREARGRPSGKFARALPALGTLAVGLAIGIGATTTAALADPNFRAGGVVVALEPDATLRVVEADDLFEPVEGSVRPGSLVRIVVENRDDHLHSFTTTSGPGVDADNLGSRSTEILARAPDSPGEWKFVCKYHPGMTGLVRVE